MFQFMPIGHSVEFTYLKFILSSERSSIWS